MICQSRVWLEKHERLHLQLHLISLHIRPSDVEILTSILTGALAVRQVVWVQTADRRCMGIFSYLTYEMVFVPADRGQACPRGDYHLEVIEPNKLVKSGGKECWWVLFACTLYFHGSHVHVSLGADAVLR